MSFCASHTSPVERGRRHTPGEELRPRRAAVERFVNLNAAAHEQQLAGATVMRGQIGFGRHSRVHSAKFLELSTGLPIVVEIIDTEARVQAFLPVVEQLVTEGLVTLETVQLTRYP